VPSILEINQPILGLKPDYREYLFQMRTRLAEEYLDLVEQLQQEKHDDTLLGRIEYSDQLFGPKADYSSAARDLRAGVIPVHESEGEGRNGLKLFGP
jgi:hypothetical protein